jgi:hypothetical protein
MYDGKEKKAYVYCIKSDRKFETFSKWINSLKVQRLFKGHRSAPATIFLEPNPTRLSIASILNETNYVQYWKKSYLINISDILLSIKEKILPGQEFSGTSVQRINNESLEFRFVAKDEQPEKKLLLYSKNGLYNFEVHVFEKIVQDIYLPFSTKKMERTLDDILNIIRYVFFVKICSGQCVIGKFINLIYYYFLLFICILIKLIEL